MKQITTCLVMLFTVIAAMASGQSIADFTLLDMRSGLPESRVRCIGQTADGRIVIVTAGTITIYDGTRFTPYSLLPNYKHLLPNYHGQRHLTCDSTGIVWLRNDNCLYAFDTGRDCLVANIDSLLTAHRLTLGAIAQWPVDNQWRQTSEYRQLSLMAGEEVTACLHDVYGGLWVGLANSGMLYRNLARRRQFRSTSQPFGHAPQLVYCSPRASELSARFAQSATNCTLDGSSLPYTYIGTRVGVMIIDRAQRLVATLDERDGLGGNNIVALLCDQHHDVWAATASGITRIRTTGRDSFQITNYGLLDGIDTRGREFLTCQMHLDQPSGMVSVGFTGGSCTFHPDSVTAPCHTFFFPRRHSDAPATTAPPAPNWWWQVLLTLVLMALTAVIAVGFAKRRWQRQASRQQSLTQGAAMSGEIAQHVVSESKMTSPDERFLQQLRAAIEQHLADEDFSVQSLSDMLAMDRTVLYRRMQSLTGVPPSVYIKGIRMSVAGELLRTTDMSMADVAVKTGFSTTKYFSSCFKEFYGCTPNIYREQHKSGRPAPKP